MKVKVSVVQDHPVFLDLEASLDKVEKLVKIEAEKNVDLILFPESFLPGYPRGFDFGTVVGKRSDEGKQLYQRYHENSFDLEGAEMKRLVELSRECGLYLVMGVTEKNKTTGSLYCSSLYISPSEGLMGVHRKIKPTGLERLIWAEADGASLVSFDTKIGRMGGLICWENYMPLARTSMYQDGVELYLAPTADARTEWTATMQHIALEGRCYVLGCNQYFKKAYYPEEFRPLVRLEEEEICRGGSVIVGPDGKIIAGPLFGENGVLRATLNLGEVIKGKLDFDPVGHYHRPDIFSLKVEKKPSIIQENSK